MQFKFERVADFYYNCGFIDHVTRRCHFKEPTRVTMGNRVLARMYGPWLRAKENGSISFVNPVTDLVKRQWLIKLVQEPSMNEVLPPNDYHFGESSEQE